MRRFVEACRRPRTILPATTTIERLCAGSGSSSRAAIPPTPTGCWYRLEHLRRLDFQEGLFHDVAAHRITRLRRQGERYFADGLREFPDNRRLAILAVCAIGRAVPYLTMRAFIVGGSNNGSTTSRGERAVSTFSLAFQR